MTTNEEAHELYKAVQDLDAARQLLLGASAGIEKSHNTMLNGSMECVFQRIESAKKRIENVNNPFGSPSPELVNVIDAIREHAEVA